MYKTILKNCIGCHKSYEGNKKRIYCSKKCFIENNQRFSLTRFSKQHTPWNKGGTHSEATRLKLSLSHIGKRLTEEHKRKIGLNGFHFGMLGKQHTKETRLKMGEVKKEEKAYQWKGDKVGYFGLHVWVNKKLGKPDTCEHCGSSGFKGRQIHWANKSQKYKRELTDWLRLCAKCHKEYDKNYQPELQVTT